jgi:hypothetical protein
MRPVVSFFRRMGGWWRDFLCPKEHGSWSLAFEPLVLSLLVAPSVAGGFLTLALAAGFFARRPLRLGWREHRPDRRRAAIGTVAGCIGLALIGLASAIYFGGTGWLVWLAPVAVAGGIFAWFDLRGGGRAEPAEIAGSAAFALTPAAFAALAGWTPVAAVALAIIMVGRSVPSVLCVRAFLRAAKSGTRRDGPCLIASGIALAAAVALVQRGLAPPLALLALAGLTVRALALLVVVRPAWRARTVGMGETVLGVVFVLGLAATWQT